MLESGGTETKKDSLSLTLQGRDRSPALPRPTGEVNIIPTCRQCFPPGMHP